MFTGIIEETGVVESVRPTETGIRLSITARKCGGGLKVGHSIAVNGCCLTVAKATSDGRKKSLQFDLLQETWQRTNLQHVRADSLVNLERSLQAGGRLGGHFVTGHIDAMGKILTWERVGADHTIVISPPAELMRYIVHKGSIAVDGISLTVAKVAKDSFQIWIIPHTLAATALRERAVGDWLNLEADILGKYVERLTAR
ncbi:MAG: riboflavin synthase [Pedosphaera sp.]|nr:riboflavin synthase [Pedosphaera sp.]MSU43733.1 riboflavin synthase [Pedosphaera sp.]